MIAIPSTTLWLGHAGDVRDWKALLEAGIDAVVDLAAEEEPMQLPRQLVYCRCPLTDGGGNSAESLTFAVNTVVGLLERKFATLLACSAGLSRSPTIAAYALAKAHNKKPVDVVAELKRLKPIDINPALWSSIES